MHAGEYTGAPEVQKTGESVPRRILGAGGYSPEHGHKFKFRQHCFLFVSGEFEPQIFLYASDHAWAIAL